MLYGCLPEAWFRLLGVSKNSGFIGIMEIKRIMENKMEITIMGYIGFNGKYNGNYYNGLYRV